MNRKMILYFLGWVMKIEAGLMVLPFIVCLIFRESESLCMAAIIAFCAIVGHLLSYKKPQNAKFFTKEGYVAVALSWIVLGLFGAMPFYQTNTIPSFVDALFETVSGFTTTGASILNDVEHMSKGIQFWRSFTHWVGGMGVLVFVLALLPVTDADSIHLMRAESPGPSVGKLVPRVKSTAKILYGIYIFITIAEMVVLMITGMPVLEAMEISFGTVGTGGFGVHNDSCTSYSTLQQGVITFFMIACGVNFNMYFLLLAKKPKDVLKSEELRTYLGIILFGAVTIAFNVRGYFESIGMAFHHALFQVATCMTTTGFGTSDFDLWPTYSKMVLVGVMFVGGCAGSTAGGIKVSRIVVAFKTIRKEMQNLIHPRAVKILKFEGKPIEHNVLRSINVYFMTYMLIFVGSILLVSLDGKDVLTTVTAVIATFNNIGPGLGGVGPTMNYSEFGNFAKLILTFDMLAGRLELFPLLLVFSPSTWRK